MRKLLLLGLLVLFLLRSAEASDIVLCTASSQEISVSDQLTLTVYLNNTQNSTVNDTVEISFPVAYLSCNECIKQVSLQPYSSGSAVFYLQALSASSTQITVTKPSSYTCPFVRISVTDASPPSVSSASPLSAVAGQSATFTASASDNVGIAGCNFTLGSSRYQASAPASFATSLSEGNYSTYFECWDAAGNIGKGAAVMVTVSQPQLSAVINLPKTAYYPLENFEPRVAVRDNTGKIFTDATVRGSLAYASRQTNLSFFYSALCDCYKAFHWFDEGTLPGTYAFTVTASHPSYSSAAAASAFSVVKPSVQVVVSTDKTEYNPGDQIKITAGVQDGFGNLLSSAAIRGEIRDADTWNLVTLVYPRQKDQNYYYEYYIGPESLGKNYIISFNASWKEQSASDFKRVSVTKRGLNADVTLEKNVLMPGDILQGKIKVFDKNGAAVPDAKVFLEFKDIMSKMARPVLSAIYKDGFYEIEKWMIDEWTQPGNYTLSIIVDKGMETITLSKIIEITKQNMDVRIIFDQSSYAPGDRMYVKIFVAHLNGTIIPNVGISGEIFPLEQEVIKQTESVPFGIQKEKQPPGLCRLYVTPLGPLFYKGEFVQRYYIDDIFIPEWCPVGKYVMRLRISAPGYKSEAEYSDEFTVAPYKLLVEAGFKINSRPDAIDLSIYAEAKDEYGKPVSSANIRGYLHPLNENGCIKRIQLGYDDFIGRYTSTLPLSRYECPADTYLLEITASQASYAAAVLEQAVEINYSEGFQYNVVVPPSVGAPTCREVSCGTNCINKICETPPQQECYEEVTDKACISACTDKTAASEQAAAKGVGAFDIKNCINGCVKKMPCRGSSVAQPQSQEMLDKLENIRKEITGVRNDVNVVQNMLTAMINFINSVASLFGRGQVSPINVAATATPAVSPLTP